MERELLSASGIDRFCIIRANTIKDTLAAMDLSGDMICTNHPRAVLQQNYYTPIDENEKIEIKSSESRPVALFRHIRNSLAHGNTYFFKNGNVMIEDKDNKKITARILLEQKTLLDWIGIVDKDHKYYNSTYSEVAI